MKSANFTYDPNKSDYGVTSPTTGNITIGPAAFKSAAFLNAAAVHELGHSILDRVLDSSGNLQVGHILKAHFLVVIQP